MPKETHTQCKLRRPQSDGTSQTMTSWIPSKVATKGATVRLKEEDGTWTEGWQVMATYATMPSDELNERSRDYTRTRKASDI